MSYKFIEPLEEKPKVKRVSTKKSLGRDIVKEFDNSNVKYAKVPKDKIKDYYHSTIAAARAMGRILSTEDLSDQIDVYSDEAYVYLERKK